MRRSLSILAAAGLIVVASGLHAPTLYAQHAAGLSTSQTIVPSTTSTRVLDVGSADVSQAPKGWNDVGFDDSTWDLAAQVSSDDFSCLQSSDAAHFKQYSTAYWGSNYNDTYLIRQSFTLAQAKSYGSSSVTAEDYNYNGNDDAPTFINGNEVATGSGTALIGTYLKPGTNVLAIYVEPAGSNCSGFMFTLHLCLSDVGQGSSPKPVAMTVLLPGSDSILTGNTLPFQWRAFPKAAYYYLQFWLVNPAGSQSVTSHSVTTFTARLRGTSYTLNTSRMPRGAYAWRMAAVGGRGKLLTAWTSEQSVTLK